MLSRKEVLALVATSFCASVAIGMTDGETESLVHLFTAEWGNILTMTLLTGFFSLALATCLLALKGLARLQARN